MMRVITNAAAVIQQQTVKVVVQVVWIALPTLLNHSISSIYGIIRRAIVVVGKSIEGVVVVAVLYRLGMLRTVGLLKMS